MDAISLFSGAGGLDLGCESAGFETVAVVELDDTARATMLANRRRFFPRLRDEAVLTDILKTRPGDLLERAGLRRGEATLLHGGPPCTPFSKSGYWLEYKRAGADPRASLLDEYVRMLRGIQPRAFLMENVYGLAYRNQNRAVLDRFLRASRDSGYAVDLRILLAADLGVPQLRQRLFCVGVRRDLLGEHSRTWEFRWPEPTHSGPHETRKGWDEELPRHATAGEALASLPARMNPSEPEEEIDGTHADSLRKVPPGENYLFWTAERGHRRPRF
jgi:DNA (cytosine-5)-methyltransferase 1